MLGGHLINLDWAWAEWVKRDVTKSGETLIYQCPQEPKRVSLVVSWLGTGVEKMQSLSASEPMVGWKGEHPQSIGWL